MTAFRAPRGTFDLVPPQSEVFLAVREALAAPLRRAGYGYIETPAFEDTGLFVRGVGESTDVVTKEMYTFASRGGSSLTLRPEGTASVLRAVLEHGLDRAGLPVKLWYSGSFYRYERPQRGRYRHFSQVGAEALGSEDPALDAELVVLAADAYRSLGLTGVRLLLNSLGCRECRPGYRARLQEFLQGLDLDEETRRRAQVNPLRVLDDKRPEVQAQLSGAPLPVDGLDAACQTHHDAVRSLLADAGVAYVDEPRLVRGLDYYTRTTFEFVHDGLGAQSAVGGGGRYDGLAESIGGPALPGVGWALGVDRTVLALEAESQAQAASQPESGSASESAAEPSSSLPLPLPRRLDVYAVPLGEQARRRLFLAATELRRHGVRVDLAYATGPTARSIKSAMKGADRSGAAYALLLGERDVEAGVAQLKDLTSGQQVPVPLDGLVEQVRSRIGSKAGEGRLHDGHDGHDGRSGTAMMSR